MMRQIRMDFNTQHAFSPYHSALWRVGVNTKKKKIWPWQKEDAVSRGNVVNFTIFQRTKVMQIVRIERLIRVLNSS